MGKKKRARFEASLARVNPERYTGHDMATKMSKADRQEMKAAHAHQGSVALTGPERAVKYDDSEPRDDHGRWTGGSGSAAARTDNGHTEQQIRDKGGIFVGAHGQRFVTTDTLEVMQRQAGTSTYNRPLVDVANAVIRENRGGPTVSVDDANAHISRAVAAGREQGQVEATRANSAWAPMSQSDREPFAGAENFANGDPPRMREVTVEGTPAVAILDAHGGQVIVDDEQGNNYAWDATDPGAVAWMATHPGNFSAGEFARAGMEQILGDTYEG